MIILRKELRHGCSILRLPLNWSFSMNMMNDPFHLCADLLIFSHTFCCFRLCPYFNGKHHIEEIMYYENVRRSQLLTLLDKFRDVLVMCQHQDSGILCYDINRWQRNPRGQTRVNRDYDHQRVSLNYIPNTTDVVDMDDLCNCTMWHQVAPHNRRDGHGWSM